MVLDQICLSGIFENFAEKIFSRKSLVGYVCDGANHIKLCDHSSCSPEMGISHYSLMWKLSKFYESIICGRKWNSFDISFDK